MAGYVKVWTSIKSNPEFLSLSLVQRGAWYELLVAAKNQRDDGMIFYRNFSAMGMDWGCEGSTAEKIIGILEEKSLLTYSKNGDGGIAVKIVNYRHWQDLTVGELVENSRKNPRKIPPLRPDQTKPDHKEAVIYFCERYEKKFSIKYDFKKQDGAIVKRLLGTHGLTTLKLLIDQLFITDDDFIAKQAGRTLGVLSACSNKLAQEVAKARKMKIYDLQERLGRPPTKEEIKKLFS